MQVCIIYEKKLPKFLDTLTSIPDLQIKLVQRNSLQESTLKVDIAIVEAPSYHTVAATVDAPILSYSAPPETGALAHLSDEISKTELVLHLKYAKLLKDAKDNFLELLQACTDFHRTFDTNKILETALKTFLKRFPKNNFEIFVNSSGNENLLTPINPTRAIIRLDEDSPVAQAARSGQVVVAKLANQTAYYLPLLTNSSLRGTLEMIGNDSSAEDVRLLQQLLEALSIAISNVRTYSDIERLSNTDDLTQLYNSRYLYRTLEAEIKRARRYKTPLSIVFIDLDGFKQVNDINGHLCGSATLVEVAKLIASLVRETDTVARYGGDEFVIILPEATAEVAAMIAERLRSKIEQHVFHGGGDLQIHLTASFGIASYPEHASTPAALIRCADKAMYTAKGYNKNRVIIAK
ncbi:MAG: GGDEF domain-containing protein [Acidobacteriota bacterium]|nr:GGDEF domain-containing protein [Blastocatellia bacterium]MDW8411412.1 GGDEF domain-containing protein [Acidobacteriota bacterium]